MGFDTYPTGVYNYIRHVLRVIITNKIMAKVRKKQTPAQSHINRIIGQTQGVAKMIDDKKDSIAILGQIMAVKASLEQLGVKILREEARVCNKKRIDQVVDTFFRLK